MVAIGTLLGIVLGESDLSLLIRFVAQITTVFVALAIFFVYWLPLRQQRTVQSVFISSAFLAIGFLGFGHIVTCSMTTAIFELETPVGSFFHMMIGVTIAATLFVAALIPSKLAIGKRNSYLIIVGFLSFIVIVSIFAIEFGSYFPSLCPHGVAVNPLRLVIEAAAFIMLLLAIVKYYMLTAKTKEMLYEYLTIAAVFGAYNHIAFSLHQNPFDLFSITSNIMIIICLIFVFIALFGTSISQPYIKLINAKQQTEMRRKEAEAASVKAQTYLDFLSHDVANMILPIMGRAEMISMSADASAKQKEEALKIIDQMNKVSSLIVNIRRLSYAERIDLMKIGYLDLRVLLPNLKKKYMESIYKKTLSVTIHLPEKGEVKVFGGSVAEEVITEIFDNAVKHGGKPVAEVEVLVQETMGSMRGSFWDIAIIDNGPGIPDYTKAALKLIPSGPDRKYTKGVTSSLSIMSLITESLGGRVTIENRVKNDHTKGTRIVITLPKEI